MWCEDKELSKYNKYKAKNGLSENGASSEHARVARSLAGVLLGDYICLRPLACACTGLACVLGRCHDHDRTYPYSPYPNLSTPIPSHLNHSQAPNAKPELSDPLRLSNALPNTPTPLRLVNTFPT